MTITQVNLASDYGGAERHVLLLCRCLGDRGHTVTLCCHPQGRLRHEAEKAGINTALVAARSQMDIGAVARLSRCFFRLKPQVVHLHTPRDYVSGLLAVRLAGVPAVVATRHMIRPVKPIMRRFFRLVDAVVCLTGELRDRLISQGVPERQLHEINGAIDVERFQAAANDRQLRTELSCNETPVLIGVVGRLVKGKGHKCLIEAAAAMAAVGMSKRIRLLIVGDGPEQGVLQRQVHSLGIAERVRFTGFQQDIPRVLGEIDILALPSTDEELLPLVVMEAMAAGCPVVAAEVGGVAALVVDGETGILVPPGDPIALAAALQRMIDDPVLAAKLGAAGYRRAHKYFALPRMAAETERLYERLLYSR